MTKQPDTFLKSRLKSFKYAFNGLSEGWRELNFRIHIVAAGVAILLGLVLGISRDEWLAVVIVIGLVLFAELVNTSLERLADVVSPQWDDRIKVVKDVAAAAVFVAALMALVVGVVVFVPPLIALFV